MVDLPIYLCLSVFVSLYLLCVIYISIHQKSLVRNAQEGFEQSMNVMMKATQNVSKFKPPRYCDYNALVVYILASITGNNQECIYPYKEFQ